MNFKLMSISAVLAVALSACHNKPKTYESIDDYPVYEQNDLGVTYTPKESTFRIWSPTAQEVRLNIYNDGLEGAPCQIQDMKYDINGTWVCSIKDNLLGKFYTFQIKQNNKWLDPTPGIWAKAVGCNGERAAIIDFSSTNPEGWNEDKRPELTSFTDAIIYEVHMRDFTVSPNSGSSYPGKFLGLCESGTKNKDGLKTGLDHLVELGVTHVQILPSYDYGSIDETKLNNNEYNWGYDPKNYNVPEGGYSTDPYNPSTRIKEFKTMVQRLHKAGIRVIMDVVYNHTFVGGESHLNLTCPNYFYRFNNDSTWSNGSGCGNETASERTMMRRFMIESIKYWINEYHIDGFRFDLMGIHDIETMNAIRAAVDEIDPSITIHGEGWSAGECGIKEELRAVKANANKFAPIAVFSDDIRDAIRGNWTEGNKGGFIVGNGFEESIKFGVVGATAHPQIDLTKIVHSNKSYATSASQVINYFSCHDDPCIVDKLKAINPNFTENEIIRMDLLGQTIVLTSQGVPFIYAGEEILRDKKGVYNSYKSPDNINQINWENKTKYPSVFQYYQGLIAMRKNHPAFRMSNANDIAKAIKFINIEEPNVVAYTIDGNISNDEWEKIMIIYNGNNKEIDIDLGETQWTAYSYDGIINHDKELTFEKSVSVPPISAMILYK